MSCTQRPNPVIHTAILYTASMRSYGRNNDYKNYYPSTVYLRNMHALIYIGKKKTVCAVPENTYPSPPPPPWKVFCFAPPVPPGNSTLASYFAFKILASKTPLPRGISNDYGVGMDFSVTAHSLHRSNILISIRTQQMSLFNFCINHPLYLILKRTLQ